MTNSAWPFLELRRNSITHDLNRSDRRWLARTVLHSLSQDAAREI